MLLGGEPRWAKARFRRGGQAVVLGQPCVHHAPVARQQVADRDVFTERSSDGLDRFPRHALLEPQVVVGVELPIGRKHADAMQFEPLVGEGLEKTVDLRVGDHPRHLRLENFRPLQRSGAGGVEERLIGKRSPEKIGEPAGKLEIVQLLPLVLRIAIFEVAETLRREHAGQGRQAGRPRLLAGSTFVVVHGRKTIDFVRRDGPAPGPLGEPRQAFPHLRRIRHVGRPKRLPFLAILVGDDRPLDLYAIDEQRRMQGMAIVIEELVAGWIGEPVVAAADEDAASHREHVHVVPSR